jgi:ADP-ribose pyrophosphatase YjhB (NUDIX family)
MPKDVLHWTLTDYNLEGLTSWSSLVLIKVMRGNEHIGYVFVIDRKFGEKAKHKMPAGHNQERETPLETAAREALGETGVTVTNLLMIDQWKVKGRDGEYWKFLFTGEVTESRSMSLNDRNEENEGEEAEFFTIAEFERLVRDKKFLRDHYDELVYTKQIAPIEEKSPA